MKFIKDKNLLRNLANQIDLLNTINGGVSETLVRVDKRERGAIIRVSAPSVQPEAFQVVLHNNILILFSTLKREDNPELVAPLFHQTYLLPPQVNLSGIEAVHENDQLQVRLPYYEATKEPRVIEIKQI
jgi:HSP20 family protein